jgi:lipid-A-disaccharide synthase-like uncharacterized protein
MMLVRFVAVSLIGVSLALLALAFAVSSKVPVEVLPCVLKALPAVVGLIMLVKARAIAEWLDDILDG